MVQADDDEGGRRSSSLTINTPEWRSSRNRLEVSGRGTSRETVTVVNAYDPSQVLGSDDISRRSNRWSIRDYRPSPVPCRIRATQSDGQVAEREVSGAPDNCAPKTPGAGNTAPTANANGPYPGTAGQAVSFSSAGSIDPDGTIDSYSWSFGDGSSSSQANPNHSYASANTYTVTLTVTDNNGATGSNSTSATITTQSPANQPPTANAGPNQTVTLPPGFTNMPVTLNGGGSSDTDGTVTGWIWTGTPDPDDEVSPTVMLGEGTHSFSLVVTDNGGGNSEAAEVSITVNPPMIGGDPHATITAYNGPSTCVACHESEAQAMHGSVHYQQSGPTDYATNIPGPAGERWNGVPGEGFSGINTYCGAHETSPRFTCAGCHVGNGRFPKTPEEFTNLDEAAQLKELGNIDCLMCHQEQYKRFPDPKGEFEDLLIVSPGADGKPDPTIAPILRTGLKGIPVVDPVTMDFDFVPADPTNPDLAGATAALMEISAVTAAQTVHATTRKSCLNCHGGAGGGDGTKRGDMSSALIDPDPHTDYHMSSAGAGLVCADCHAAGDHRVIGRGVDLRPNDVPERLTCTSCHEDRPHGDYNSRDGGRRDTHAGRVACQTCHIPTFAKVVATEVARDWEDPHYSDAACNGRGGWLPREDKAADLTPTYQWFDGTSEVYYLTEPVVGNVPTIALSNQEASSLGLPAGSDAYVLGMPNGSVASEGAKLAPMKEHLGKVALNTRTNTLVAHSTFEFFRTGDFQAAVLSGMGQMDGMSDNDPYEIVGVHTYQGINHGVEPSGDALACGACHSSMSGGPVRMDLQGELGYELKGPTSQVCRQCHGQKENMSFAKLHDKHVRDKRKDCSTCHNFSRPERGLSTSLKNP